MCTRASVRAADTKWVSETERGREAGRETEREGAGMEERKR